MTGEEFNPTVSGETCGDNVGDLLKKTRESRGQTDLAQIAREICIRPHLLEALEQNNFSAFPSACYASGFLKNYAAYLGLHAGEVVSKFKIEYEGAGEKVELVFPEVPPRSVIPRAIGVSIGALSLVMLVTVGMIFGKDQAQEYMTALEDVGSRTVASLTQADVPQESSTEASEIIVADAVPEQKPVSSGEGRKFSLVQQAEARIESPSEREVTATPVVSDRIRLTASADVWVRISGKDGEIFFDRVVQEGEEFFAPDRKGLNLMTSNASALSVFVGDVAISPLGDFGQIVSELALDQSKLLQKTAMVQH